MYIWNLKKKKVSDEPRGRTEIKTQMLIMDLRTRYITWGEQLVAL